MLRMTPDQHARTEISAGLHEEHGATVVLSIDLDANELVGRIPELVPLEHADGVAVAAAGDDDLVGQMRIRAEVAEYRTRRLELDLEHLTEHAEKLRARLEDLKTERSIVRDLLPDEAREVAAMLWHYADRSDAPK